MPKPTRLESFDSYGDPRELAAMLDLQATFDVFVKLKDWAWSRLRPKAGDDCLDVGCGTGLDVQAMAAAVAPKGQAIGIDLNWGLYREAVRRAEAAGSPAMFLFGDALQLPFADNSFDVVRCERVLQYIDNPYIAVLEMVRVLRPGGRIVLIDTDWTTAVLNPLPDDIAEVMGDLARNQMVNPKAGRRLREYLAKAGLRALAVTSETWLQPQEAALQPPISLMGDKAVEVGLITQEQANRLNEGYQTAAAQGWFHSSLTMFGAYAVKPLAAPQD